MDKQEYDNGYKEAIEAIKKALAKGNKGGGSSGSGGGGSDVSLPPLNPDDSQNQGGGSGSSQDDSLPQPDKDSPNKTTSNGEAEGKEQGVVDENDMTSMTGSQTSEGNGQQDPGGMIDKNTGDKICDAEGYDKNSKGSDESNAKAWQERALEASKKFKGDDPGNFISRLNGLYKTKTDWKKAFKHIVGRCISKEHNKESRFTNGRRLGFDEEDIRRSQKDARAHNALAAIYAFIDTSGSMGTEELRLCLSEVYELALQKKPVKIITIQCDTKIQEVKEYKSLKEMEKEFKKATVKGGGGTELKPCWDYLAKDKHLKNHPAELVMVFTDGYLDQYKRSRCMKNLCWCIIDNPKWTVKYNDTNTMSMHLKLSDIK